MTEAGEPSGRWRAVAKVKISAAKKFLGTKKNGSGADTPARVRRNKGARADTLTWGVFLTLLLHFVINSVHFVKESMHPVTVESELLAVGLLSQR